MKCFIGIDVGKQYLDVHIAGKNSRYENNEVGLQSLIDHLKQITVPLLIIFEATGGYEHLLQSHLIQANMAYHKAHPNKVRAFAKCRGQLAKTDQLDAKLLSEYAQLNNVFNSKHVLSKEKQYLKTLINRREQLLADKNREENRLDKKLEAVMQQSIQAHLQWIGQEIKRIEQSMKAYLAGEEALQKEVALYQSVPGIGLITAICLIVNLPELGQEDHKPISALVGVAPMNQDSGNKRGKRAIRAGRANLRKVLYMATLSAVRVNPVIKVFYQRLKQRGKESKVALTAAMRKLITLLNSIAKRRTPWQLVLQVT